MFAEVEKKEAEGDARCGVEKGWENVAGFHKADAFSGEGRKCSKCSTETDGQHQKEALRK